MLNWLTRERICEDKRNIRAAIIVTYQGSEVKRMLAVAVLGDGVVDTVLGDGVVDTAELNCSSPGLL